MKTTTQIIAELIPPNNHSHRNGFSNEHIILELTHAERIAVKHQLTELLRTSDDCLVGETLVILDAKEALPVFQDKLNESRMTVGKIIWASYIYELDPSRSDMKEIALSEFPRITNYYSIMSMFYYLSRFNDSEVNKLIEGYMGDEDLLLSYNSKRALELTSRDKSPLPKSKETSNWWEFWKKK